MGLLCTVSGPWGGVGERHVSRSCGQAARQYRGVWICVLRPLCRLPGRPPTPDKRRSDAIRGRAVLESRSSDIAGDSVGLVGADRLLLRLRACVVGVWASNRRFVNSKPARWSTRAYSVNNRTPSRAMKVVMITGSRQPEGCGVTHYSLRLADALREHGIACE